MKVSVIICTFNRCKDLSKTLRSLAESKVRESVVWDVLVVDNHSSDGTREVAQGFCRQYPDRFRYLYEPRAGKSNALNAGIHEAQSTILAFLDDDVTVEPTWLDNLTMCFHNAACAGVGGRIVLQWPQQLPNWLAVDGPYSRTPFPHFDEGTQAKELMTPPFGANMAFRKCMFEKYGGFRTDLGPGPNRDVPRPNEDTEFGHRLLLGNERLCYEPSAVVYHPIAPDRIDKKYFLDWWFDAGRAGIRGFGVRSGTKWRLAGVPLYLVRSLGLWLFRWIFSVQRRKRFYYKVVVWGKLGGISECHRQWRSARELKARGSA